ncbi:MAG: hypothetical protein KA035_02475 [Candidatus Levybacteria bacterium]|nr:hypothetical protein [Candidatus Levybacteria bacterium]
MRGIESRINPKNLARTMFAASLPIAAGLSACGDGATKSGMPSSLESPTRAPIAGPANPTPEPGRTTITLEANCIPTNPNTLDSYEKSIAETVVEHGGAIVVTIEGLTCEKNYAPYINLGLERKDAITSPYDKVRLDYIYGFSDGSPVVVIFPATSCEGEYSIGNPINDSEKFIDPVEVKNEITGVKETEFKLNENCIKYITLKPDTPRDLN